MSKEKAVETLLEMYFDFLSSTKIEEKQYLWDIEAALQKADLNDVERKVITFRYLQEPVPPQRDRVAKNGYTNGRPLGGTTQNTIASLVLPDWETEAAIKFISRIKISAIAKIAAQLSDYYDELGR